MQEHRAIDPATTSVTPAPNLRAALQRLHPDRQDLAALDANASDRQAWSASARMVGMSEAELARALAPLFDVEPAGGLNPEALEAEVLGLVPFAFCQKELVLPLRWRAGALEVAASRPFDVELRERLGFLVDRPLRWLLAPPAALEDAVLAAYAREGLGSLRTAGQPRMEAALLDENAVVRLTRELFAQAVRARASDLHIQPYVGTTVARIRVDGALRRLAVLPDAAAAMVIRHVKARGGMEPTNTLVPQDGRQTIVVDGREYALRLSTLPVAGGERLVVRFLPQGGVHRLADAGFSLAAMQALRRAASRPWGLIVFTGPTGSGKTSTLYAMLTEINRSEVNILTVEDPAEYRVTGISQVEVNDKAHRSFGAALRSILRQDPDVILIGEIRDRETAEIAAQAAMTGHLVLTTLHTNDAVTAVPRLLELGVQPSVLANALAMVASQRLCRRLCTQCRVPLQEPLAAEERVFEQITHNRPAYRAVGCEACDFTGFHGRLPIVDILELNPALRDAIGAGEQRVSVLSGLRSGDLKSLAASGSLRVISGDTTVAELQAAVGPSFWSELATHFGTWFAGGDDLPSGTPAGQAVLLIGRDPALADTLRPVFAGAGLRLLVAASPEEAGAALREDEDVAFILGDLPDGIDLPAAVLALQESRRHIAWARLPAAVLLPDSLAGAEEMLRESGAMATFCRKPADPAQLLDLARRAQVR